MTTSEARATAGFTLLEMLVVLLIAGMALALTTQALGQYQRAYARASASEQAGREYRLSESWFRDSVRGLRAAPEDGLVDQNVSRSASLDQPSAIFRGRKDGFSGLTLAPVLAGQGIPVIQAWRVVRGSGGRDALELLEEGERLVLSFPGGGHLQLHYLDEEGELHDQWPPALGTAPQLPAGVVLELVPGNDGIGAALVVAAVAGPRAPLMRPYEPEPF